MISVNYSEHSIFLRDREKNELVINAPGWISTRTNLEIPRDTDLDIGINVKKLELPESAIGIESSTLENWKTDVSLGNPCSLPEGNHLIKIENFLSVYLRSDSAMKISRSYKGEIHINFPSSADITLGFRTRSDQPDDTLRIVPSCSGLANAINSVQLDENIGPERSFPSVRSHPPLFEFDNNLPENDDNYKLQEMSSTSLELPHSVNYVFVSATLSYYLGSTIILTDTKKPRLVDNNGDLLHEFDKLPAYIEQLSSLLQKIFYLDCVVRGAGKYHTELMENQVAEMLSFDASVLYKSSPLERLKMYLLIDFSEINHIFPKWNLTICVEPALKNAVILPYLLNKLGLIALPKKKRISNRDFIELSLRRTRGSLINATSGIIDPELPRSAQSEFVGWCSDGIPLNGYKTLTKAVANKGFSNETFENPKIAVILNENSMRLEQYEISKIYQSKAKSIELDIDYYNNITTGKAENIFQKNYDFIHFIGHCDYNGLHCSNGKLKTSEISSVGSRIFFLNACNSYEEGMNLVEKGSIGGVATIDKVLDAEAVKVGVLFAKLMISGFSIQNALNIAQNSSVVKNYLPIGDGTFYFSQGENNTPSEYYINRTDNDEFQVDIHTSQLDSIGGICQSYFLDDIVQFLRGNAIDYTLNEKDLKRSLEEVDAPVFFEGEWQWSDDFIKEFN